MTGVEAGSPLAEAMRPGDTVLQVDGEWVYDRESFSQALDEASSRRRGLHAAGGADQ